MDDTISKEAQELGIEKNTWLEIPSVSVLNLANSLYTSLREEVQRRGFKTRMIFRKHAPSGVIEKFLETFFASGLKDPEALHQAGGFRFRIVDIPQTMPASPLLVLALAFEIELELTPRYAKDGQKGVYIFRFFIKAHSVKAHVSKPPSHRLANMVDIRASCDAQFNQKTKRQAQKNAIATRIASIESWERLMKQALRVVFNGGLPGLGKKR